MDAEKAKCSDCELIHYFKELPDSLYDIAVVMNNVFAGRVVFTPEALESAKRSDFSHMQTAWSCLWAVCTVLWGLYSQNESNPGVIKSHFDSSTNFELGLTEGSQTKKHGQLMETREIEYSGHNLSILPHVKVNKKGKYLRVHFAPFIDENGNKMLIIGHCGDHLNTSGTRRMS